MRLASTLIALSALALPSQALAAPHAHAPAGHVEHSHATAKAKGLTGVFHFNAVAKPLYTCEMHPEVASAKPGKCPKCKMALTPQSHHLAVQLKDAQGAPVTDALVRLTLTSASGMRQGLTLKGAGYYEGAFALSAGQYTVTAFVKPKRGETVALAVPYTAR